MSNEELKKKIVEMVEAIENERYLRFIYGLLMKFHKKWGI